MEFLPLFLSIKKQKCLVVGGGRVAYRKSLLLVNAGARVRLVSIDILPELRNIVEDSGGEVCSGEYNTDFLKDVVLVVAATSDEALNQTISADAMKKNLPVNVVDNPRLCSFIFPAVIDRSPLVVAISSSGTSPVLTRQLKTQLEAMIPADIGRLAELAGSYREEIKTRIPDFNQRLRFWEELLQGQIAELVYCGKHQQAKELLESCIAENKQRNTVGEVYLVGAGPGDPELLTLKALRLMQQADIVLYDRLVSKEILQKVRPDAELIHVGKERANHQVSQEDINQQLVRLAKEGKRVLRLKGGDPFIFGRGGEEIILLADEEIPFQVVPGITAASGCASYAGIPLTHRDYSQSVRFLAGHLKDGKTELDWQQLAIENQTLVFYMGLLGLRTICEQLMDHGMNKEMPVALIQKGTTKDQKVLTGTLCTIAEIVENNNVKAPTIIIVGKVVSLRDKCNWFA